MFAGINTGPSNPNPAFQKRPKEEEWDPEYTPKSKKYFLVGAILLCMHLFSKLTVISWNQNLVLLLSFSRSYAESIRPQTF